MPVKDADPAASELDAAFAEAMGAPARPREPDAPPERDPDAPHGRGDDGQPLAPYGWTKETKNRPSRPALTPAGRKSKDDQARTGPADPGPAKEGTIVSPRDYSRSLGETADGAWVVLTFGSQLPLEKIPLIGAVPVGKDRRLRDVLAGAGDRLAAQAALLHEAKPSLVAAMNLASQNSAAARRLCERLETGDVTWVMMCGALAAPFLMASRELWGGNLDPKALAAANQVHFKAMVDELTEAMNQAAAELGTDTGLLIVRTEQK